MSGPKFQPDASQIRIETFRLYATVLKPCSLVRSFHVSGVSAASVLGSRNELLVKCICEGEGTVRFTPEGCNLPSSPRFETVRAVVRRWSRDKTQFTQLEGMSLPAHTATTPKNAVHPPEHRNTTRMVHIRPWELHGRMGEAASNSDIRAALHDRLSPSGRTRQPS